MLQAAPCAGPRGPLAIWLKWLERMASSSCPLTAIRWSSWPRPIASTPWTSPAIGRDNARLISRTIAMPAMPPISATARTIALSSRAIDAVRRSSRPTSSRSSAIAMSTSRCRSVVQALLDLVVVTPAGLLLPAGGLELEQLESDLVHRIADRTHLADHDELVALSLDLGLVVEQQRLIVGRSGPMRRSCPAAAGAPPRTHRGPLAEQQHLGDLLGIAVGVKGDPGDRLELGVRALDPLDEVVGASDREIDDDGKGDHDAYEECLEGNDLGSDVHRRRSCAPPHRASSSLDAGHEQDDRAQLEFAKKMERGGRVQPPIVAAPARARRRRDGCREQSRARALRCYAMTACRF